ncbi:MAG: LegC family aminotransferase [Fuerstiella sp.]|nr:LegC family aminotransferase [Fuerstiella sp.]
MPIQSNTAKDVVSATGPFIPLSEPYLHGKEWEYVRECLDTGWVSSAGPFVDRFESDIARYTDTSHAVATINGTSALHTALLAVGIEPEDEVLVSTLTFIASVNAIQYTGACPVLIDAEPTYWQMDPALVHNFLTRQCTVSSGSLRNRVTGRRVRAIMPVHILGHPAELNDLTAIARKFDLAIIEDAAESLGAEYYNRKIGGFGDVTCFSFNGNKTITAGAGGMIVTNQAAIADRARYLTTQARSDPVEYEHEETGYNYRMSNVAAAIGAAQLECIDSVIAKKRSIASTYRSALNIPGWQWHTESVQALSTCWLSTAFIDPGNPEFTAKDLRTHLHDHQIQSRRLWRPMHRNRPYADCQNVLTGAADRIAENALSFPSSASLTSSDQDRVCATVMSILERQAGVS